MAFSTISNTLNTNFKELTFFEFCRKQNSLKLINSRELNFPTKLCLLISSEPIKMKYLHYGLPTLLL
jgi:hypothetical protein